MNDLKGNLSAAISDLKFNLTPGIGDSKCPFCVDSIYPIISTAFPLLSEDLKKELQEYINKASICNGAGISRTLKPGYIKSLSKKLLQDLEEIKKEIVSKKRFFFF